MYLISAEFTPQFRNNPNRVGGTITIANNPKSAGNSILATKMVPVAEITFETTNPKKRETLPFAEISPNLKALPKSELN